MHGRDGKFVPRGDSVTKNGSDDQGRKRDDDDRHVVATVVVGLLDFGSEGNSSLLLFSHDDTRGDAVCRVRFVE
jgi:hypothetical protein